VGRDELDRIRANDFRRLPPPPAGQAFLRLAVTRERAAEVAVDWSTRERVGDCSDVYLTRLHVDSVFFARSSPQRVPCSPHREYLVPADRLDEFNGSIRGLIEVVAEYHAPGAPDDLA
jgi:hypothetical protein